MIRLKYNLRFRNPIIATILLFVLCISGNYCNAQDDYFAWARQYRGSGSSQSAFVLNDKNGNIIIIGTFNGKMDFNPGAATYFLTAKSKGDVFIQKLDSFGNFLWVKQVGARNGADVYASTLDAFGNILIAGNIKDSADFNFGKGSNAVDSGGQFVLKLDNNGNYKWLNIWKNCSISSISSDSIGEVFTSGSFVDTVDFDPGPGVYNLINRITYWGNAFVEKMDSSGKFIWVSRHTGKYTRISANMVCNPAGSVFVAGNYIDTVKGSFYNYAYFSKLNHSGKEVWNYTLSNTTAPGSYQAAQCASIVIDKSGYLIAEGTFSGIINYRGVRTFNDSGGYDNYIMMLDSNGSFQWSNETNSLYWGALTTDLNRNIYLLGAFDNGEDVDPDTGKTYLLYTSPNYNSSGGYIQKMDSNGKNIWAKAINYSTAFSYPTPASYASALSVGPRSAIYFTGVFQDSMEIVQAKEKFKLISSSYNDIFLYRLSPCYPSTNSITQSACDSFTINKVTYKTSGVYTQKFVNYLGCDSILTINLTLNSSTKTAIATDACKSYTFYGTKYTKGGTYKHVLTTFKGCDSIILLTLTFKPAFTSTLKVEACDSFRFYGKTYTYNGYYPAKLTSVEGCDSNVTLHLGISSVYKSISQTGNSLKADQSGAKYQWLDCNNGYSILSGDTNQVFTPVYNGNYAVTIASYPCYDTSICYNVTWAGINTPKQQTDSITVFPNPSSGLLNINFGQDNFTGILIIEDMTGRIIYSKNIAGVSKSEINLPVAPSLYLVKIFSNECSTILKVLKQ